MSKPELLHGQIKESLGLYAMKWMQANLISRIPKQPPKCTQQPVAKVRCWAFKRVTSEMFGTSDSHGDGHAAQG